MDASEDCFATLKKEITETPLPLAIQRKIKGKQRRYVANIGDLLVYMQFLEMLDLRYSGQLLVKDYQEAVGTLLHVAPRRIEIWRGLYRAANISCYRNPQVGMALTNTETPIKDLISLLKADHRQRRKASVS
jgi:hypothetical protein